MKIAAWMLTLLTIVLLGAFLYFGFGVGRRGDVEPPAEPPKE